MHRRVCYLYARIASETRAPRRVIFSCMENARKRRGVNLDELQARGRYDAELLVAVKTNKRNHGTWKPGGEGGGDVDGEAFQLCIRSELRKGSWTLDSMVSLKKITIPRQFNSFVATDSNFETFMDEIFDQLYAIKNLK